MHHMKQASGRDLRYNFPAVERMLREGETIEITKCKRVIGRLTPVIPEAKPKLPDFLGRMRKIYGNRVFKPSNAELIARERDRY
jgi:antitoxin (DNA-binding transcriptional repressor) of toxin-antitoxin stability system